MYDHDAYVKYPRYRKWFNKLWVAEELGYNCGPSGIAPEETLECIVRPIYNLAGMGVGARFQTIQANDIRATEPGYFWCERFYGRHISACYRFQSSVKPLWIPIKVYEGFQNKNESLSQFSEWKRLSLDEAPTVPRELNSLSFVPVINVEFIDNKVIEVHLRSSPDPNYDHIIPVWAHDLGKKKWFMEQNQYDFIESFDDADGHLDNPRVGFLVK